MTAFSFQAHGNQPLRALLINPAREDRTLLSHRKCV